MIDAIKYFLLGLIQGFTEPLPISSSGHVTIFREIFNITFEENFLIIVNFGSLLAIIFYFRKMIKDLIVGSFNYIFKKNSEKQVENK
ncbi:MAG: undecaprenyl-diphosphate phosphatase, partial [Bacilli bacterium]|nr:undecaprenyl-diphosphate phosphatase [Bacilli bacterium]